MRFEGRGQSVETALLWVKVSEPAEMELVSEPARLLLGRGASKLGVLREDMVLEVDVF